MKKQIYIILMVLVTLLIGGPLAYAAKDFNIKNNTQSFFYLNGTSGNVGIGSVSPGTTLDVNGTIRSTGIGTSDFSSNVGIGSATPGTALDVQGITRTTGFELSTSPASGDILMSNAVGVGTWIPASSVGSGGGAGTNYWSLTAAAGNVGISTTNTVGIGTTSAGVGTGLAVMNGNVGIGTWAPIGGLQIGDQSQGASNYDIWSGDTGFADLGNWVTSPEVTKNVFTGDAGASNAYFTGLLGWTRASVANASLNAIGVGGEVTVQNSSGTIQGAFGIVGEVDVNAAGNQIGAVAIASGLTHAGTGTLTGAYDLELNSISNTAGTITNAYGIYSANESAGTNNYNIFINQTSIGPNDYSIYSPGTAKSYFAGNMGIGSSTPGQILDVQGTVRTTAFTMSGQTPISGYVMTASDSTGDTTWSTPGSVGGWTVVGNNVYETSGGNVGIGTSALQTALAVTNGNVGIGTWTAEGGNLIVKGGGNVGIGSAWPGTALDVQGTMRFSGDLEQGGAVANGLGNSVAFGYLSGGTITSSSVGSLAGGSAYIVAGGTSSAISSSGFGSIAYGYTLGQGAGNNSSISATGQGAVALGNSFNGSILSSGNGAIALGIAIGSPLQATQSGSVAIGDTVQSTAIDADALGANITNNISDTFMVGFNSGATLTVTSNNVGIGSTAPGKTLDVQGTVRMTGFTLTTGATAGYVMVGSSVGIGTWMSQTTLPVASLNAGTIDQVPYYSAATALSGSSSLVFAHASGNMGLGTVTPLATLQIIGNVGIGTVKNGDNFITNSPPGGGMILEGDVGIGTWLPDNFLTISSGGTPWNAGPATAIHFLNTGYGTPTADGTVSNGDKLIFWNRSDAPGPLKEAIGADSFGLTLQASGVAQAHIGFWTGPGPTGAAPLERMRIDDNGNVGIGTTVPTALLEIRPGTATTPPIQLNSGTNLTAAAAGSVEFDGTSFYATAANSSRQVIHAEQFMDISSAGTVTLANVAATPQKIFSGVTANGALTVQGNTLYFFEGQYLLSEGTGTNHTTQMAFALGGGASLTSINYTTLATPSAANTETATTYSTWVNQATATPVTASAQPANLQITFQGAIRVNAGGTITPEVQFNNAPGATGTVNVDTYFRIWPVGSNSTQSQGDWS